MKIRKLVLILTLLLVAGCSPRTNIRKAVYFYQNEAQLSLEELQAHPEVLVVQTFDELKNSANQKIAIWVDKNAAPFDPEQEKWINQLPQAYYPIVLIGTSDTLYAFKNLLGLCCFMGPAGEYPGYDAPGFSVIQWEATNEPDDHKVAFLHGFDQKPTVQSILDITNDLLDGKVMPTPISTLPELPREIATAETSQVLLDERESRDGFPNDAAKILSLTLEGNILTINVTYQGNCREHIFALHSWSAFLQSNPPQGVFYLSHDAQSDTCTENVERLISFDLTPLEKERNDPSERPLLLRIYEPIGGSFAREPVMPLIEWP